MSRSNSDELLKGHKTQKDELKFRTIYMIGSKQQNLKFCNNATNNQKYSLLVFAPCVLYDQFKQFFSLYFLLLACSQFIPSIRVGPLLTYIGPLIFVVVLTTLNELKDEIKRYKQDKKVNEKTYKLLKEDGNTVETRCSKIKVGDIVYLNKNERIPADLLLLWSSDVSGTCFIRTDQLDGETDWKLKNTPNLMLGQTKEKLLSLDAEISAESPNKEIYKANGVIKVFETGSVKEEALDIDNFLWANTVLASNNIVGIVLYTGKETRAVLNTNQKKTKLGLFDKEINRITIVLFILSFVLSSVIVAVNRFHGAWIIMMFRFLILFSFIIPLSLRINLDFAKLVFAKFVMRDKSIPKTTVRTSTIPEELGRIEYLLTDKTGTLTQNIMRVRKVHLGTISYNIDSMDEFKKELLEYHTSEEIKQSSIAKSNLPDKINSFVQSLAVCHNVTPIYENDTLEYQAASPDEVAIVEWTQSVGVSLIQRSKNSMKITSVNKAINYEIMDIFPFTSETKRMGIVVKDLSSNKIAFLLKGADSVMKRLVNTNDWLDEECDNMAREGFRTLVVGRKYLSSEEYYKFKEKANIAMLSLTDRNLIMQNLISEHLENNLSLIGIVGIEDKLQNDIKPSLEKLRNAGIKIWMTTGDKIETAICIGQSSKMISKTHVIKTISNVENFAQAKAELESIENLYKTALVIDGPSIRVMMNNDVEFFAKTTTSIPVVICCRCSPTQKAELVQTIKHHTGLRVCSVGDGGNDVSMIQAADVGVGIVGKEGKQASLAADYSITEFSFIVKLILWHGRNSYKRSAKLSQFVIHRGLIISIMQALFSLVFYNAPVSLYQGFIVVGYATIYTSAPVFSIILDKDIDENISIIYPELYKELRKGRSMSMKVFFYWLSISIYQAGSIIIISLFLFESIISNIISMSFTALVFNELLMVMLEIKKWHRYMIYSEILSLAIYVASMFVLREDFDIKFVLTFEFLYKVALITLVSSMPLYIIKLAKMRYAPPSYTKLA